MYCKCGCGGITNIIKSPDKKNGYVVGEYRLYINNHHLFDNKNMEGKKHSRKARERMRTAVRKKRKFHKLTEEHKKNISLSSVGKNTWMLGRKQSEHIKNKEKRENSLKAFRENAYKFPKGNKPWNKGIHHERIKGENHWNWQGGKTKKQEAERKSSDYRNWRRDIFIRDEFTCQECGIKNVRLEAHHIKSWSEFEALRFDRNNGLTLCEKCHIKTDSYGRKIIKKLTSDEADSLR